MLRIPITDGKRFQVIPVSGGEPRQKVQYENGVRTDKPVLMGGLPVFVFDAALALDGAPLGTGRVESTTSDLPVTGFGEVFQGDGASELLVYPQDNFNLRLTMVTAKVERTRAEK